jgi:hypothetical protein
MDPLDSLRNKIQKIDSSSGAMDRANDVLRDLEDAIKDLHRKVFATIESYIDPSGSHVIWMEYRRGEIHGIKQSWGLFIRDVTEDPYNDDVEETSWHWANAPGVLRVKAAENKDRFVAYASSVADSVIAELPT